MQAMTASFDFYWRWLEDFVNREPQTQTAREYRLENMEKLAEIYDHPEKSYECWHVAGSKGKGSVSAMIAAILAAGGEKVGLYQSPHVTDWRERIRTPTGFFADGIYLKAWKELYERRELLQRLQTKTDWQPSWFELVTLLGMLTFRQAGVKTVVFEVGLGGRLDATNVIIPVCSVITPIEREHTQILGETLEEIAGEKCGIIKKNIPVVTAEQAPEVLKVIQQVSKQRHASLEEANGGINATVTEMTLRGMQVKFTSQCLRRPISARLPLIGEIQAKNAATAILAVKTVKAEISEDLIEKGLAQVWLPGRFEWWGRAPLFPDIPALIFDGAHTPQSLTQTIKTWKRVFPDQNGGRILFACAADKDMQGMAELVARNFWPIVLTRPGVLKKSDLAALISAFDQRVSGVMSEADVTVATVTALSGANRTGEPLLVTGSFYLLAEVQRLLGEWQAKGRYPEELIDNNW